MSFVALAFLVGVLSGLRAFMALVTVAWAARLHRLNLENTRLEFLGYAATPFVATALGLFEFVTDQLPSTPNRTAKKQFIPRLLLGGFAGVAIGLAKGGLAVSIVASLVGVVIGTYGGAAARGALAKLFKSDRPAAFVEDGIAIALAVIILVSL